ncbi:MAG: GNAT family N-acetyltransferase [Syntrophomonas sp.]
MQLSYQQALEMFRQFDRGLTCPGHHPDYIIADALRGSHLAPVFFGFQEGGNLFYHGFHLSPIGETGFTDIQSAYGYGGPIVSSGNEPFLSRAWSAYDEFCAKNKVLAEFIRFHPLLNNWLYYRGEVVADRQTVWIDLNGGDLLSTYLVRARTAIRKAGKNGVRVEWWDYSRFGEVFPTLYFGVMKELNARPFYYFSPAYFNRLLPWPHSHLATALVEDKVIAAAVFLINGDIMEYHLSASTLPGKNLGAGNLILHEAALRGRKLGCRCLHLGGGTDNNPDNSLLFFKAGFSEQRALFRTGKHIHLPDQYRHMKDDWLTRTGAYPQRVLFYRQDS